MRSELKVYSVSDSDYTGKLDGYLTYIGFSRGSERFEMERQDCHYQNLPVSRYRDWCLEKLREAFTRLNPADQARVKSLLPFEPAEILWQQNIHAPSDHDTGKATPFNLGINVFDGF